MQDYLRSAQGLYDALEYERALEELARARRFATGASDDALLPLFEGVILADLGKSEESTAAFKAALLLRPDATLPVKVSPKVEKAFEAVRLEVKRELAANAASAPATESPPEEVPKSPSALASEAVVEETPVTPGASSVQNVPPTLKEPPSAPHTLPIASVSAAGGGRRRAWLPATMGGALVVSGGVSFALSMKEKSKLRNNDARLSDYQLVKDTASRGRTLQTVGVGLMGAGVVGLGVAAGMYLLGRPTEAPAVELGLGTNGTSAFVSGRWP